MKTILQRIHDVVREIRIRYHLRAGVDRRASIEQRRDAIATAFQLIRERSAAQVARGEG